MKHILAIILFLVGFTVSAQVVDTGANVEFHLGEYVFKSVKEKNQEWTFRYDGMFDYDHEEIENLGKFIKANRKSIETKYGIVITDFDYCVSDYGFFVKIKAADAEYYKAKIAERDRKVAKEREDAKGRMKSLEELL